MRLYAFALFASCCFSGCAGASQPWVEIGGQRYAIELADDDVERARGLMFRDAMANDQGMLFIHDAEEPQAYWMKNTKIPLDILYFDDDRKLVAQQRDVPPCSFCVSRPLAPAVRTRMDALLGAVPGWWSAASTASSG